MRRTILAAAVLALLPFAPAPAQDLPTLRIGLADDADALDPTIARTFVGRIVFAGLCDKLVDIDTRLNIVTAKLDHHMPVPDGIIRLQGMTLGK